MRERTIQQPLAGWKERLRLASRSRSGRPEVLLFAAASAMLVLNAAVEERVLRFFDGALFGAG